MRLPSGFQGGHSGKVFRLQNSLYGLKQAPPCWFSKLANSLREYGFCQSYSDYSLFTYQMGATQLNVLIYVDDLIFSGTNSVALLNLKKYLCSYFHMKDLGVL